MNRKAHSSAVLLWIDDDRANDRASGGWRTMAEQDGTLWPSMFGNRASRLFSLMDIAVDVVGSLEEAAVAVEFWTGPDRAGTHVFAIVDLCIPRSADAKPEMRCGIQCARDLHRRKIPFVFLSSNSGARGDLDSEGLGAVPFHVKEGRRGPWRLPDTLGAAVLREFVSNVTWLSLEHAFASLHPESSFLKLTAEDATQRTVRSFTVRGLLSSTEPPDRAFLSYPYFGVYRDFVDRWTQRSRTELPGRFVVRAAAYDSDEFIQQSLLIMLHEWFVLKPKLVKFRYGLASEPADTQKMLESSLMEDPDTVCVVRVEPAKATIEHVLDLIVKLQPRIGTTIFVLPDDESSQEYAESMSRARVPTIEELPHIRHGDRSAREELARNACALVFVNSRIDAASTAAPSKQPERFSPRDGWLAFPQLLIHPVYWMALLESEDVAARLSDSFEVVKELHAAVHKCALVPDQYEAITRAVQHGEPIAYRHLLRVGERAVGGSDASAARLHWHELALDMWLTTSWQFPHGLQRSFAEQERSAAIGPAPSASTGEIGRNGGSALAPARNWTAWEDNAYEILAHLCAGVLKGRLDAESDLGRVARFLQNLNGAKFLREDGAGVNWEALESLRWPHHRYPMPIAVSRRLKAQGRHLWIQPEGLDLAAALPSGRVRYRGLGDIAAHYWDVLSWTESIVEDLPLGWKECVGYLVRQLRTHRIAQEWPTDPGATAEEEKANVESRRRFWEHLSGILRNGLPVMFIAEETLRGRPLTGAKGTEGYLADTHGYGKVLDRLRSERTMRVGDRLRPKWGERGRSFLADAQADVQLLDLLHGDATKQYDVRATEVHATIQHLLRAIGGVDTSADAHPGDDALTEAVICALVDPTHRLFDNGGWFRENFEGLPDDAPHAKLRSLMGTKIDHVMKMLDTYTHLNHTLFPFRYFDGYHLLSVIGDLRNKYKDATPQVSLATINTIMELFVTGIQGVLAHLAWCLELAGHPERAARIRPPTLEIVVPPDLKLPSREDLDKVLRVQVSATGYAVYTLGIPGEDSVKRLSFHHPQLGTRQIGTGAKGKLGETQQIPAYVAEG